MRATSAAATVSALVALALAILAYVPIAPAPLEFEPDLSFRATTHDAFARGLQFGRQIVSTYGPWGILQRGFDRRTDTLVLLISALLAAAFAWGVVRIAADAGGGARVMAIGGLTAASLVIVAGGDGRFTAITLLLLLSALLPPSLARELPLVAALGWIALIKFSLLIFAAFVVIMVAVTRRRMLHAMVFVAALLVAWIAAKQSVAGLPLYFMREADVAAGYAGASVAGSGLPIAAAGAAGLALFAAAIERNIWRTILIAGATWYLMRIGYVRADPSHTRVANALLLREA